MSTAFGFLYVRRGVGEACQTLATHGALPKQIYYKFIAPWRRFAQCSTDWTKLGGNGTGQRQPGMHAARKTVVI